MKEILGNRDCLPEYASDFRRLSPEVVLDMFAMHEQHARDLMTTFAGIAERMVVASSVDVYRSFGRIVSGDSGLCDPGTYVPERSGETCIEATYQYPGTHVTGREEGPRIEMLTGNSSFASAVSA